MKWGAVTACLCLVLAGIIEIQSGWLGNKNETAVLSNGESTTFHKTNNAGASIDLNVEARSITAEELTEVFGTLPIENVNAYFTFDNKFVGLEGKYEGMKLVISASSAQLADAVVFGNKEPARVNGIPIAAGYFITNVNSQGVKMAIYYAFIELDDCTIYIENAGIEAKKQEYKRKPCHCC